jgi:RNA polymerase sigma factor (sigma-70 family)
VAGDADGLAEAYDRYAAPLYTYCRSLLREPADAADAVQDTFVIAASKLAGLRDQSRLRPWLYAVARNECHRRLRETASGAGPALDLVPEMRDESADVTGGAERAELRTLLRSAVRGLNASEQDLIELQLRQELDVAEIAAIMGVSRNHAHALLSRARSQLEISLGALLVARSGRGDCAALSALLQDWDGQLNVLMRKRINRHIEQCPACSERKRRELAPALLLGAAALPAVALPPGLRTRVLRLASSNATAHRSALAQGAVMSGASGFPVPFDQAKPAWWRARRTQGAAAAAVVAAAAVLVILAVTGVFGAHHSQLSALDQGSSAPGAAASSGGTGLGGTGSSGTGSSGGAASGSTGTGSTVSASGSGGSGHPGGTGPTATAAARVAPSPSAGGSTPPAGPAPGASSPAPGRSPSRSPSRSPAPGHSPSPGSPAPSTSRPAPPPPPPPPGTLSVAPRTIVLSPLSGGALTVTASGGPVDWSITESPGLIGELAVAPASGHLQAGQSATVSLRASAGAAAPAARAAAAGAGLDGAAGVCVSCTLTVNPGDITVTVLIEVNASPSPTKPSCPPSSSPSPSSGNPEAETGGGGCRETG